LLFEPGSFPTPYSIGYLLLSRRLTWKDFALEAPETTECGAPCDAHLGRDFAKREAMLPEPDQFSVKVAIPHNRSTYPASTYRVALPASQIRPPITEQKTMGTTQSIQSLDDEYA
jgi:hypothetical protein